MFLSAGAHCILRKGTLSQLLPQAGCLGVTLGYCASVCIATSLVVLSLCLVVVIDLLLLQSAPLPHSSS